MMSPSPSGQTARGACGDIEGGGKGLSGRGLRINRRGPEQCGLQRKSVLLQMFPGGLGVWSEPGRVPSSTSASQLSPGSHSTWILGGCASEQATAFLLMRKLCFKEIGFIFTGLGVEGGGEASKQKLEPLKKT